jgi:hypothetical protein
MTLASCGYLKQVSGSAPRESGRPASRQRVSTISGLEPELFVKTVPPLVGEGAGTTGGMTCCEHFH